MHISQDSLIGVYSSVTFISIRASWFVWKILDSFDKNATKENFNVDIIVLKSYIENQICLKKELVCFSFQMKEILQWSEK